ncbi:hypothetical protein MOQ_005906 [Trypanosoma cruzi marinkellei]|uniref:Uncharacterized protein n=1 Tax=Trypanosoma cruzi marinkellei TaxID=85056 RepID=K2M5U4_TRYCR|nr:hypothetical protein MOQ_005906 [Trypanosoma cruzi marinkellei]
MRAAGFLGKKVSRVGWCLFGGVTVAASSHIHRASWHTSTRCIVSGGVKNEKVGKPAASSVKRMPPPPPPAQKQQKPGASSSHIYPEPPLASQRPLLDVEDIICALVEVFVAYQKHLLNFNTTTPATTSNTNKGGGTGVNVPFYPPVPLEYMEEKFESLLLRLLPAGLTRGNGDASKVVRFSDNSADAEKNRRHISSRIQSSGVFHLTSMRRRNFQREGASNNDGEAFFLRIRPGVRELAVDIAAFLFSLEPQNGTARKAVPLMVIRRMSLSPANVSFVRHELANDVRRLLLVYTHSVFLLTKNGTMVQLLEPSVGGGESVLHAPSSNTTATTREQAQELVAPNTRVNNVPEGTNSTETTRTAEPDQLSVHFTSGENDTVVHMGKRFIAPTAMERYRLSQRLIPFLEFVPLTRTVINANNEGNDVSSAVADTEDGFVDFVAVRNRAVAKYPSLAPLLTFDYNDLPQLCDGPLFSALRALGVEFCLGRPLPPQCQRKKRQQQQQPQQRSTTAMSSLPVEMGLLFLRRIRANNKAAASTPISPTGEKMPLRLLLSDLQAELDETMMPQWRKKCWPWPSHIHPVEYDVTEGAATNGAESHEEELWSHAFVRVHAAVYEELATTPAEVMPYNSTFIISLKETSYPVGVSANSAFVQHLLRQLTPRQHEKLHDILLRGVQGRVSPLIQHEIEESVACLFFPYGQSSRTHGGIIEQNSNNSSGECNREAQQEPIVFNKYVEGFYDKNLPSQLPFVRPRTLSEEPPLVYRRLLPAKLVLEIVCCLHREQLRHAEEIGLEVVDDDDDDDEQVADGDGNTCFLSFVPLRQTLQPASRTYVRDYIGDLAMIPLLVSCFPRYFRVPAIDTVSSWSSIGLTREGRHLAQLLEASSKASEGRPLSYRSQRTGCFFTDDTRQQMEAFLLWR